MRVLLCTVNSQRIRTPRDLAVKMSNSDADHLSHIRLTDGADMVRIRAGFKCVEALGKIIIRGPYPPSNAIIYMHLQQQTTTV